MYHFVILPCESNIPSKYFIPTMKLLPVALVLIFTIKMIVAKTDDDSSESHDLQSEELKANTSVTSLHVRTVPSKAKKFIVSLTKPTKTTFNLPKRGGQRNNRISKFQIQNNVQGGNDFTVSTRRPHLMQSKKFTSKPHAIDHAEKLIERSNFKKRRTQSTFNQFNTEDKHKIIDQNTKKSKKYVNRFPNFTDIDVSSENDSDESKAIKKPLRSRYMKPAASNKVKATASPPFINVNSQKNYKIKELLKNQRYIPRADIRMVPVLDLQRGNVVIIGGKNDTTVSTNIEELSTKKNDISPEENADQNEFIFVKDEHRSITTASPENEDIVTGEPFIE